MMNPDTLARFGGIQRLYGVEGLQGLAGAHVCVVGLGGVGSWTVEALARSGLGALTLIDLDDVCISNVNRQVPALTETFGRPKADVLAKRIQSIHPACKVDPIRAFFTAGTASDLLRPSYDFVFDAIDQVQQKCLLIASCRQRGLPILTVGGSGGRRDPTAVQVRDLGTTSQDRLLQKVRKLLRSDYGFPKGPGEAFQVDCVYSTEPPVFPQPDGTVCSERTPEMDLRLDCRSGYGTASFVTGTFGFVAAGYIVDRLARSPEPPAKTPFP